MENENKMNKKTITILHVFTDEKFFDGTARFFLALPNVTNLFYYYSKRNKPFKHIKNEKIIKRYTVWNEYTSLFKDSQIDIIYFHSLPVNNYRLFKYIDSKKIVIWWCWGYDIYYNYGLLKPFIELELYKPLTKQITHKKNIFRIFRIIYHYINSLSLLKLKKIVINRIDYFSPVIPLEYELMKNNSLFKAKPFMLEKGPGLAYTMKYQFMSKTNSQNILLGNSLTFTNNHLDILDKIKDVKILGNRLYIVPINYGNDYDKDILKQKVQMIPAHFKWLESFLPINEYRELFDSISHAIFGHMRQQAMGNINLCLRRGIKVYLFKDSIIYKQLKIKGYHVFTIEDDLNEKSLAEVLSEKEAFHNYELYCKANNKKIEKTIEELETIIFEHNNQF